MTTPLCGATKTDGSGNTCKHQAGWGTDHPGYGPCRKHGGNTRNHRTAALRSQAEDVLTQALDDYGAAKVTDPVVALQELAGRVKHALDAMGERVNQLTSMRYEATGAGTEQLRAEVAVWERMIGRLHPLLVDMARLGIEDRLARVSERQGEAIVTVLQAAAAELGLDMGEQQVRETVGRHLRVVDESA